MTLTQAENYAEKIRNWIMPCAFPTEVAGSIRRKRPVCNDIDIVCVPKIDERKDMLGEVLERKNLALEFLRDYVKSTPASRPAKFLSGGHGLGEGKQALLQLPGCQLDLWFADEKTFATRLLCRTGSMWHNIWLASRAKRKGWKWNPYEGILTDGRWVTTAAGDDYAGGHLNQFATEGEIYAFLDLPFIEPKNREIEFLAKNFGP